MSRVANRIVRTACRGRPVVAAAKVHGHGPGRRGGAHGLLQQPLDVADPPPGLGPDQQVRAVPPRRGEQVVEIGLAIGHRDDPLLGRQGGLGGGQGVEPALALLLGGRLLVPRARLPSAAGSRVQVRWSIRPSGTPAAVTAIVECSQSPVRLGCPRYPSPAVAAWSVKSRLVVSWMARIGSTGQPGSRSRVLSRCAARMSIGVDAWVIPEAIGGLGGGPIAARPEARWPRALGSRSSTSLTRRQFKRWSPRSTWRSSSADHMVLLRTLAAAGS